MRKFLASVGVILLLGSAGADAQTPVYRTGTEVSDGASVTCYSNRGAEHYRRAMSASRGSIRNVLPKVVPTPPPASLSTAGVPIVYSYRDSAYRVPRRILTVYETVLDEEGHKIRRPVALDLSEVIAAEAKKHDLDPLLVELIIKHESAFNPYATSRTGAQGLMQLMPGTAALMGVRDAFDPRQNVAGGVAYFAQQLRRFQDLSHALAAYNAGPGAVAAAGGVPAYAETQNYVAKICGDYNALRKKLKTTVSRTQSDDSKASE